LNEEEHEEFFSYMKTSINSFGVENFTFLNENKLLRNIDEKIYLKNENIVFESSKNKIINYINKFPDFQLFYKSSNIKNFDPQDESDEKELYSLLTQNKINYFSNYDEFLKSFYSDEEFKNYKDFEANQIIFKFFNSFIEKDFTYLKFWKKIKQFKNPVLLGGKVITGFQRGSRQLGIATANLEMTISNNEKLIDLLCGVYVGTAKFLTKKVGDLNINLEKLYKCVLSIGWNPYFDNSAKTIEVFFIDYEGDNFYDEELEVSINSFIRTEANFENFGELVTAITYDIIEANNIL